MTPPFPIPTDTQQLLAEYDRRLDVMTHFAETLQSLLGTLLVNADLNHHAVQARIKDRKSVERKALLKGKYSELAEMTDVVGLRVIALVRNDVKGLCDFISGEFEVDWPNSSDKGGKLEPDKFGYSSVHLIVSINATRSSLREYSAYAGLKAEIQVRSLLEHAWAEVEHAIGYRSESDVPEPTRRQFARLAGLFELADDELGRLRGSKIDYQTSVRATISTDPFSVPIDLVSLREFINVADQVAAIDTDLQTILNLDFVMPTDVDISALVSNLQFLGIDSIGKLAKKLGEEMALVLHRATFEKTQYVVTGSRPVHKGISIAYLCQMLAAHSRNLDSIVDFLNVNKHFGGATGRRNFAAFLLAAAASICKIPFSTDPPFGP
jgi:putative GTP pyrophosphokinase